MAGLEACQEDARFSHLKDMHYVKEDRLAYNVITLDMNIHPVSSKLQSFFFFNFRNTS